MITFLDGPALGACLWLKSAPLFLRVVQNADGEWDALDQPSDMPVLDETISVYRRKGEPNLVHVLRLVNGRRSGGWHQAAQYELDALQPADAVMRDNAAWRTWVAERVAEAHISKTKAERESA